MWLRDALKAGAESGAEETKSKIETLERRWRKLLLKEMR